MKRPLIVVLAFVLLLLLFFSLSNANQRQTVAQISAASAPSPTPRIAAAPRITATPRITAAPKPQATAARYILNTNTKKFHKPSCTSVTQMKEKNKQTFYGTRTEILEMGYSPCQRCHP